MDHNALAQQWRISKDMKIHEGNCEWRRCPGCYDPFCGQRGSQKMRKDIKTHKYVQKEHEEFYSCLDQKVLLEKKSVARLCGHTELLTNIGHEAES